MIFGIGTDIISIKRIDEVTKRRGSAFAKRILTQNEYNYYQTQRNSSPVYLASRFAAKEAVAKALGTGIGMVSFQNIETSHTKAGQPMIQLSGYAKQFQEKYSIGNIHISISDEEKYVVAFAIATIIKKY